MKGGCRFAMVVWSGVVLAPCLNGQHKPATALTPEQQAYRQQANEHARLQAEGKQVFDTEMAREKAGDCKDAQTTDDFDTCFDKQLGITEQNLKRFEDVIRKLQLMDTSGSTPQQFAEEFDRVEQSWREYRDTACKAAYDQFEGGSGAPSFEMECSLKLTRNHMRELDFIYGEDLHL
jgi:uncharacterized protein YecT (DUF1311 family)